MIITCEACNTSFNLDDKMLKPTGSKVRCSVCAKVFTAYPQPAPTPVPDGDSAGHEPAAVSTPTPEASAAVAASLAPNLSSDDRVDDGSGLADALEDADLATQDVTEAVDTDGGTDDHLADMHSPSGHGAKPTLDLDMADEDDEVTIASLDDEDLDLLFDDPPDVAAADTDSESTATMIVDLDDDMLGLDDDFSLESEPVDESIESAGDAVPDTLDDLDDLDLSLDLEEVDSGQQDTSAPAMELDDDLDLSSLESLLQDDDEDDVEDDTVTMLADDGEEPELTLDLDDEPAADKSDTQVLPEDTLEDLEIELDADGGDETAGIDALVDDDQDIDLSEIEKMLEEPETEGADLSAVPEQDLDLDIDADLSTEKWMPDNMPVKDEELDLSEFEQVLEDVDTDTPEDPTEEPELVLDLEDEAAQPEADETVLVDNALELDLSDFEDDSQPETDAAGVSPDSDEMELEFEVEDTGQVQATLEAAEMEETVAIPITTTEETAAALAPTKETAAPVARPKPVKKGVSKSLVFLLIVIILGGGGYGAYYLMDQKGIEIPFLSDYLKPKVNDPGNLKITTYDINAKFVDNASVGKLFVISGKVKNSYPDNRGMITLVGNLYSTGKVVVNEEKVYCGNVMSDLELANLEWDKIKARLANRLGDNRSNVKIEPGQSIPFMVVFSGLPDDLEEYTIKVTGSTVLK